MLRLLVPSLVAVSLLAADADPPDLVNPFTGPTTSLVRSTPK